MSVLAHIGYGVEKKLITAIVVSGQGMKLTKLVANAAGVLSVTHHHARGTGRRQPGALLWTERDVVMVLVEAPQSDDVFAQIFAAADLGEPNQGIIFVETVSRGHPMMPFDV
ncbi:P-II family nitrogen regulator [Accumulibacter sp.]|uniref:P-II family nitrogen regulator n=1 Tax=Accumulibacter sp. TaxID=2053492 RepID=UPI001D3FA711|nr:P-II family nitrogen regulator [Accumulibacter sp.]MCB1932166.1 hypothetical protein [Accumulibacter sp.]MCB1965871.1 hypothetical protein [Accumulibacter sp.]MCP5228076.1 hypothetical protein [Accumulibacter sp.]